MDAHIDSLLERYLLLLDEYTSLRSSLANLQGAMYQNIARANFSAERGIRYGQDFYDQRMQALRRVMVDANANTNTNAGEGESEDKNANVPIFSVSGENRSDLEQGGTAQSHGAPENSGEDGGGSPGSGDENLTPAEQEDGDVEETKSNKEATRNPLRWFGLITPMPLRMAQEDAIKIIENVVPRLATVNAEMLNLEIEVRRARKRRAKAESRPSSKVAEVSKSSLTGLAI